MKSNPIRFITGFICLFVLYHAAEYMILFKNSPGGFLGFQGLFFLVAWVIAQWQFKAGLNAWGLDTKKYFIKHLLLGMLMGIALYGLTYMIDLTIDIEKITAMPPASVMVRPLLLFAFGNFFSSVSEDILTRGYFYRHLNQKISMAALITLSATVYLLNHIYRLGDGFVTYLYLFLLGILYIIPLLLTRRLWFTGGMHWAGNSFFYFTHGVIQTGNGKIAFSANYTLSVCVLLFIPVSYYVLKKCKMITANEGRNVNLSVV